MEAKRSYRYQIKAFQGIPAIWQPFFNDSLTHFISLLTAYSSELLACFQSWGFSSLLSYQKRKAI